MQKVDLARARSTFKQSLYPKSEWRLDMRINFHSYIAIRRLLVVSKEILKALLLVIELFQKFRN